MDYIYCFGMINPSTVYLLNKNTLFPEPNGYGEVDKVLFSIGGEAANTAIMLSKLGIKTILDGTWIVQEHFKEVSNILGRFNIDYARIKSSRENSPNEIVIADGLNRTCFGNFDTYQDDGPKWNSPNIQDILGASMVALDPYFKEETREIARVCIENSIPYITLDSDWDTQLAKEAEVLIISQDHRDWHYPEIPADKLFTKYQDNCNGLVIFTFGKDEIWYGRRGGALKRFQPFKIDPIDTSSAGDSFRSGIIYSLINKFNDDELIKFSSAVSACVCLSVPHAINATDLKGVEAFIREYETN